MTLLVCENNRGMTITCNNTIDLSSDKIFITFLTMKHQLITKLSKQSDLQQIQCNMTPLIKNRIIQAYKKRKQYGKSVSCVKCFDIFANEVATQSPHFKNGVLLNIIDPSHCGTDTYLELYSTSTENTDDLFLLDETLPF